MAIDTDGCGTVLAGDQERYVIEIIDPGRWASQTAQPWSSSCSQNTSRACPCSSSDLRFLLGGLRSTPGLCCMHQLGPLHAAQAWSLCRRTKPTTSLNILQGEAHPDDMEGMVDEPGVASASLGGQPIPHKSSGQTARGMSNANSRRTAAFRQGLVRVVAAVHDAWLASNSKASGTPCTASGPQLPGSDAGSAGPGTSPQGQRRTRSISRSQAAADSPLQQGALQQLGDAQTFNPLEYRCWHPDFPLADLSLPELLAAARRLADAKAEAEVNQSISSAGVQLQPVAPGAKTQPRPPVLSKKFPPCTDTTKLEADAFLEHLQQLPWYQGQASTGLSSAAMTRCCVVAANTSARLELHRKCMAQPATHYCILLRQNDMQCGLHCCPTQKPAARPSAGGCSGTAF